MKHEVLTRAIGELDDELIADAYAYKPRKRYALPRFLAAAARLVLVLAAALAMTRDTLPAEIKVEGAALSSIPIPISQPAAMALDERGSLSGPLSPMLTIESKSGEAVTVTVSDGVLTQPLYSLQEEFTPTPSPARCSFAGPSKSRTRVRFTRSLSTARPPSRCATTRPTAIGPPRGRKHPIPHYY